MKYVTRDRLSHNTVTNAQGKHLLFKSIVKILSLFTNSCGGKPVLHQQQEGLDCYTQPDFQEVNESPL